MSGGTLLVCGSTSGGDGSLDADGNMTYTGGTLLALSSKGMMEYPESGCLIATNCNAAAGEQISIVDKNGTVLATLQSPKAVSDVIYGIGDSDSADYTIVTGGTYDGTLNEDGYGEGGSVSGGGSYKSGKRVTVVAAPDEGYEFKGWYSGDSLMSTSRAYSFQASQNIDLTAKFAPSQTSGNIPNADGGED